MEFKILDDTNEEIKTLRTQAFIIEKNVPKEIEFDGRDKEHKHFCLYENNELIACARGEILGPVMHLGRVTVKNTRRGSGLGRILFNFIEEYASENGCTKLELGAVETAIGFYEKIGFKPFGEYYMEVGWAHINMEKEIV